MRKEILFNFQKNFSKFFFPIFKKKIQMKIWKNEVQKSFKGEKISWIFFKVLTLPINPVNFEPCWDKNQLKNALLRIFHSIFKKTEESRKIFQNLDTPINSDYFEPWKWFWEFFYFAWKVWRKTQKIFFPSLKNLKEFFFADQSENCRNNFSLNQQKISIFWHSEWVGLSNSKRNLNSLLSFSFLIGSRKS